MGLYLHKANPSKNIPRERGNLIIKRRELLQNILINRICGIEKQIAFSSSSLIFNRKLRFRNRLQTRARIFILQFKMI